MTLEQRLERLERENRWMRRLGMVTAATAAAVFLVGQGKAEKLPDLVVRSLTVKGWANKAHATITDAGLRLYDGKGKARAWLEAEAADGSTGLFLADNKGKLRATLATRPDGSPFVRLSDMPGTPRAVLGITTTYDKTGVEGVTPESTLTLIDANGTVIWKAP